MVTILPPVPKRESFGSIIGRGVGENLKASSEQRMQKEALAAQEAQKMRLLEQEYGLRGGLEEKKRSAELQGNDAMLRDIEERRGMEKGSLDAYRKNPKSAEQITRPAKEKSPALTEKEVPTEISRKIKKVLVDNPKATADEIRLQMDESGIPPVYSNPYVENRRRTEEQTSKTKEDRSRALRTETLPIRMELAKKAQAAEKGIQNKEQLLDIIEKGDINDPTFAALAEALPLNLGKRLLSNDTVEYKAGLVEEFTDLRNIFQGQTRIKEIDLLENKMADLYLTNDQKKAVLRSRINALRADLIRAESAAELEDRDDLGVLQFNAEVEKKSKAKLESLFNQIIDDQKAIFDSAERRKNSDLPLDPNDADDREILEQILKEAGGDKSEARKRAKKKGYKF